MKINFEKIPCYVDIRKQAKMKMNIKYDFSNALYIYGKGVAAGALALKIYNSNGEEDYTPNECQMIASFAKSELFPPILGDSIEEYILENSKE